MLVIQYKWVAVDQNDLWKGLDLLPWVKNLTMWDYNRNDKGSLTYNDFEQQSWQTKSLKVLKESWPIWQWPTNIGYVLQASSVMQQQY